MEENYFIQDDAVLIKIKEIVSKLPGCFLSYEHIKRNHRLREDIGLDSLGMVDLMVAIEDNFHAHFDPITMDLNETFQTIGSIMDFIISIESRK